MKTDKLEQVSIQNSQLSSQTSLEQQATRNLAMSKPKLATWVILTIVGVLLIIVMATIGLVRWRYTTIQTLKDNSQSKNQEQNIILDDNSGIDNSNPTIRIESKQTSKPGQVDETVDE